MPVYIGDYLRDTQELTGLEHGAYFLLLMHYWQKKGHIGSNIERLSRVAKSDIETTRFILESYFILNGNGYKNKRADEEMSTADHRRSIATINGNKGGRPTKITRRLIPDNPPVSNKKPTANPEANRNESSSSSSPSSSLSSPTTKKKDKKKTAAKPPVDTTLYNIIKTRFEKEQPQERFTNYGREGKAINGLIKKATDRTPEDPGTFLEGMIRVFIHLRNTDKFFKGHPFLPSSLNSSGIWDRVLSAAADKWKEEKDAEENALEDIPF